MVEVMTTAPLLLPLVSPKWLSRKHILGMLQANVDKKRAPYLIAQAQDFILRLQSKLKIWRVVSAERYFS